MAEVAGSEGGSVCRWVVGLLSSSVVTMGNTHGHGTEDEEEITHPAHNTHRGAKVKQGFSFTFNFSFGFSFDFGSRFDFSFNFNFILSNGCS